MTICFQNRLIRRACAAMLVFGSIAGTLRADSIIFSAPSVPLEAPPKEVDEVVGSRPDQLNFARPSQGAMVPQPQQMIQRQQPREYDPDNEEMKHPLLRDWTKMPSPLEKQFPKSPTEKWLDKIEAKRKDDKKADSLSPVTTFNWREELHNREELGRRDKDLAGKRGFEKGEREDERTSDPFRLRKDSDRDRDKERNAFQAMGLNAPQTMDQREKSALADMERHAAAFDELLNPRQSGAEAPSVKQRSSLEPVTGFGFDTQKPNQPTVTAPPVGQQVVRSPLDPTKSFDERQQRRLQGSSALDDLDSRFGPQSKASSSFKSATEPTFSTPLMRQPLTRDFPTRSF